jgi:hypothetical protein
MRLALVVVLLALLACKRSGAPSGASGGAPTAAPVSAGDVCHQLEAAGVAAKCQAGSKGDLGVIGRPASEYVTFDLPAVPGKAGKVLLFRNAAAYEEAVKGFEAASFLVGPYRYGSSKALIYVELNKAAPADVGAKAASVVSAL